MRDAFDELYRTHHETVRRFVRRQVISNADDLVAETFAIAFDRLPQDHPHPVGWLIVTAKNLIRAERRRAEREQRALREAEVLARVARQVDPEVHLLRLAVLDLPAHHREVLQLTYWDNLPAADAAVVLGCSEQAVWKRISRAKAALRSAWTLRQSNELWEEVLAGGE